MKALIYNLLLFGALVIVMSSFTGCGGGGGNTSVNKTVAVGNSSTAATSGTNQDQTDQTKAEKPSSQYPPLASAIAQANLKTTDGTNFKIADKKGKVLLINMWATWCGPCLAEMPSFVKMQDKYGPSGFEILGLDTDDESDSLKADIDKVVKEKGINYPIVFSDSDTQAAFLNISKFGGIPQSFLVDADGNLRGVFKGANKQNVVKIEEMVAEMLGQEKPSE